MIASIDGSTVVDGTSGALGSSADTAVLGALRQLADLVLVGANTVRSEGYGPPKKPGLRIGVVTSNAMSLDLSTALFTSGAGFVITVDEAPELGVDTLRAGTGRVDLRRALRRCGADFVHVEGGAGLNASLFDAGLVDELNLTISPHLAGGDGPRLLHRARPDLGRFDLTQLCEEDGYLFCRYTRRPANESTGSITTSS
jgi:riboflavin biosynthesis pyrimidine reductase